MGLGLGFGYLPPLSVGFKWYPEARGLVSGLAVGVFAAGSGIVGPVAGGFLPLGWEGLIRSSVGGQRSRFSSVCLFHPDDGRRRTG